MSADYRRVRGATMVTKLSFSKTIFFKVRWRTIREQINRKKHEVCDECGEEKVVYGDDVLLWPANMELL